MDVIGFGAINLDLIYYCSNQAIFQESIGCVGGKEYVSATRGATSQQFDELEILLKRYGKLKAKSGGGSAANTCVALTKLGFQCGFIGKIGTDYTSARGVISARTATSKFLLKEFGLVDTSQLIQGGKPNICIALIDPTGERSLIIIPNNTDTIKYDDVDLEYVLRAKFLHITSFISDRSFETQKELVKALKDNVKISFDPGELYALRGITELLPILEKTYILFITDKEVETLTSKQYKDGVQKLIDCGVKIVACKLGKKGAYIRSSNEEFSLPAEEVKVVDKTGAGDVFNAGFLSGLLSHNTLYHATELAIKSASISITGYGRKRYPDGVFWDLIS